MPLTRLTVTSFVTAGFLLTFSAYAKAGEGSFPSVSGEVSIEIESDFTYDSDDEDAELNDLFAVVEPAFAVHFTEAFSVNTSLVVEPVFDPDPSEDREFEDEGLFVQELYFLYEADSWSAFAGKFNPAFGVGWDITPGVFGTGFTGDYELTERIGAGGSVSYDAGENGMHALTGSTFFLDTTFLSDSAFTSRGETDEADGGVSNTEDFSSFAFALDGGDFQAAPGLAYHLGLSRQGQGEGDAEDETSLAAAVYGSFEISDDLAIEPVVEFVHQMNAEGTENDRDYFTVGAALLHGPWNLSLAWTARETDVADDENDISDSLYQISVGYAFDFGLSFDVGYVFTEEEDVDSNTVGALLAYGFEF